ncbi:MAG: hypothetical protein M3N91_04405 [Pseudomonadota bacterium]|nr:hypothetical protein [Pseudomonadota bacterium]
MWNKRLLIGLLAAGATLGVAVADDYKDQAAVAKQLPSAKVTLSQGLSASESKGQPISAKFEIDEGHFQLSVYTAQGAALQEVLVDYTTGKIAKADPLSEAGDLADAKKQVAAMTKAKTTLKAATDKAEQDNAGFRALSVIPTIKANHAIAVVTLAKGAQIKSVSESLE